MRSGAQAGQPRGAGLVLATVSRTSQLMLRDAAAELGRFSDALVDVTSLLS